MHRLRRPLWRTVNGSHALAAVDSVASSRLGSPQQVEHPRGSLVWRREVSTYYNCTSRRAVLATLIVLNRILFPA